MDAADTKSTQKGKQSSAAADLSRRTPAFSIERSGSSWSEAELEQLLSCEWLETNGRGGWASSTAIGCNTRRYHSLLTALLPTNQRIVYLSRLDETVQIEGAAHALSTAAFPGVLHPKGYQLLRSFSMNPFPEQLFEIPLTEGPLFLSKTIVGISGTSSVIIRYRLSGTAKSVTLRLRPFVAARDYHGIQHANGAAQREASLTERTLTLSCYEGLAPLQLSLQGAASVQWHPGADWWYRFFYQEERRRGLDCEEDLFTHGELELTLDPERPLYIAVSAEQTVPGDLAAAIEAERKRRDSLPEKLPFRDELTDHLARAADQFIIVGPDGGTTVIAGYHWFTDWGRDTMISLPGLCLVTGRAPEARAILERFASHISEGMVPNRFPDAGTIPEYNTVDGTLWFFVAVYRYYSATKDRTFLRAIVPRLLDIVQWHICGTRYGIKQDADGLLNAGEGQAQLTWMDVRIGDWVVTPRHGKPVEVNALWYNALQILSVLCGELGDQSERTRWEREAARVKAAFEAVFWNQDTGYLYDCIGHDGRDGSLRPNQLIALSLPFPTLEDPKRAESILAACERELLTPVGLRTLAPSHPAYRPRCDGSPRERDGAYHQGTIWPWLLGPYLTALARVRGARGRAQGRAVLTRFLPHLREAGIGTVSEIFDGDPPHHPRGCIAQAWSVAEPLRAYIEDILPEQGERP